MEHPCCASTPAPSSSRTWFRDPSDPAGRSRVCQVRAFAPHSWHLAPGAWHLGPLSASAVGRVLARPARHPSRQAPRARLAVTAGWRDNPMRVGGSACGGQPPRQVGDRAPGSTGIQQPAEEFSRRHGSAPRQGRGWRAVRIGPGSQGQEVPKTPRSRVAMRGGGGSRGGRRCRPPRRVTGRAKSRPGV